MHCCSAFIAVGNVRVFVVDGTESTVGLAVGFWVGLAEGLAVGLAVGLVVGLAVGLAVGFWVGLAEGCAVVGLNEGLGDGTGVAASCQACNIPSCNASAIISSPHFGTWQLTGHFLSSSSTSSSSMTPNSTKASQCNLRCCAHPIPNLEM